MDTALTVALLVPWIFWGILTGLLIVGRRSWINMLLIPTGITILIFTIASLSSTKEALWASITLHLFLLVLFIVSYISFALKEQKKKK